MIFLKNKILLLLIFAIFLVLWLQIYFISQSYTRDTTSYVTLLEGSGILTSEGKPQVLQLNIAYPIKAGDNIRTNPDSLAVIEWWDSSITRLWGNGNLTVQEENISPDLETIQISFSLLKWKTWSNVIPIFSGESYFKQEIGGVTAAVRGTVFEVNTENGYIFAHKHEVSVTAENQEVFTLSQENAYSFKGSTLIENIQDIQAFLDTNFAAINEKLDREYLLKLKLNFIEFLRTSPLNFVDWLRPEGKISALIKEGNTAEKLKEFIDSIDWAEKKEEALAYLKTLTQMVNFSGADDELYSVKMTLKDTSLEYSNDQNYTSSLLSSLGYDLQDLVRLKEVSQTALENTIQIIKDQMGNIDTSQFIHDDAIATFLSTFTDKTPAEIADSFKEHFNLNFITIDFQAFEEDARNFLQYLRDLIKQLFE